MLKWMEGIPDLNNTPKCDNGGTFLYAISHDPAKGHLMPGLLFLTLGYHSWFVVSKSYIKCRKNGKSFQGYTMLTPILPKSWNMPWFTYEALVKIMVALGNLLVQGFGGHIVHRTGQPLFIDGVFNHYYVTVLEVSVFLATTLGASAIIDVVHTLKSDLFPKYWSHIGTGMVLYIWGDLFISHALWKNTLIMACLHFAMVPIFYFTSLCFFLTPARPRSFYLTMCQCLGLVTVGVQWIVASLWNVVNVLYDEDMQPCRTTVVGYVIYCTLPTTKLYCLHPPPPSSYCNWAVK